MRRTEHRPDTESILGGLKDFQRETVDYVFRRLYTDTDPAKRFLIADEVGLGKTLVARGVVARAIDHLWNTIGRINIVYICANRDIARQNINRLNVTQQHEIALASRMTLLPLHLRSLQGHKLNFVSFTPGTSFDLRSRGGLWKERALIYHILRQGWGFGSIAGPKNLLQHNMGKSTWRWGLRDFPVGDIDSDLARRYLKTLRRRHIRPRFNRLVERFSHYRKHVPPEDSAARSELIGDLRAALAETCVAALEPDIVILDEFQRFRNLLDGQDAVAQLARAVFDYPDAKVLLLSATPYKMFTMYHEEATEDHYHDFLRTIGFLFEDEERTERFKKDLQQYRMALLDVDAGSAEALSIAKRTIEDELRKVMVRTERLSATTDRSGMISEARHGKGELTPGDLRSFTMLDRVAGILDVGDTVEYWKSGPYLLNVMDRDGYKIKKELVACAESVEDRALAQALDDARDSLLSWGTIRAYERVDPGNARLRALLTNKVDCGAWQLLWIPPSLPYYRPPEGAYADPGLQQFTKALVFSSWMVVPKVIAMLGSYEAERRMTSESDPDANYAPETGRPRPLLRFAYSRERLTGMANFTLLYPSLTLATKVDPLEICVQKSRDGSLPSQPDVADGVSEKLRELIEPVLALHAVAGGPVDERWYWAAPILLDRRFLRGPVKRWLDADDDGVWISPAGSSDHGESHFAAHVQRLRDCFNGRITLGRPPEDLVTVLTEMALASPAVVALRAMLRICGHTRAGRAAKWLLPASAKVAMAFLTLFNRPPSMTLIRSMKAREDAGYWRSVLNYCVDGNLQSVMDEYVHILRESLGLLDRPSEVAVPQVAEEIESAVAIRTVNLDFDEIRPDPDSGAVELHRHSLRCHFALRFGDAKSEEGAETRAEQVRIAFNSPFHPFILATTSIGQEGLDFHQYCHEIYHWNLPSNPVDLEQREGRIHRYKGHVIRRNVAKAYPPSALQETDWQRADPWDALFRMATRDRPADRNDLVPFWIFERDGGLKLYRYILTLPLSREREHMERLRRTLVAYRMVMGQPRQEDLVNFLRRRLERDIKPEDLLKYRIDLRPVRAPDSQE